MACRLHARAARRACLAVLVAVCVWAPSAGADTGAIAVDSAAGDVATATFEATKTACASPYYCGWFVMATLHPAAEACHVRSPAWVGTMRAGTGTFRESGTLLSPAGQQRLCLFLYDEGVYRLLAEVVFVQVADPPPPPPPVPTPVPVAPTSLVATLMPSHIGRVDQTRDRLAILPARAPAGVEPGRFIALVRAAARRWSIRTGGVGWERFRFARPDGRNEIGFRRLPDDMLGLTKTWTARIYRSRRVCSRRGCRIVRRHVGWQIVERDVALTSLAPWQQGPAYPGADEFDLETAIVHELGHWAGNRHRRSCSSPMLRAIGAGDWWRDTDDFFFAHCARASGRLGWRRYRVDVELPARLADAAAGSFARTAWAHRTASAP